MSEFDLIRRYFDWPQAAGTLGVGDDCALLPSAAGSWAVSTDLLLEHRHFFSDVPPRTLGHKALAVNLSDLAAMGARPRGFVLGLALPQADADWLAEFAAGMRLLSEQSACPLVGGDTTRSANGLAISVTVFGAVDARRALRRDAARAGDDIWVSGELGEADVALRVCRLERDEPPQDALDHALMALTPAARAQLQQQVLPRLQMPQPRLALGALLAGTAHACIDISDGLLQDLGHVLNASACGAQLQAAALPVADSLSVLPLAMQRQAALGGGDVYELCFTANPDARTRIAAAGVRAGVRVTRIGTVRHASGLQVFDAQGLEVERPQGYDHFA